jgi:hypothetical protein
MLFSTSKHNTGRSLILAFGFLVVFTSAAQAGFVPISQPNASYVASTTLLPITADDFDLVSSLSAGGLTATFDTDLVALTTPGTWSSWGSPPNVESSTPRVLWTNGLTSLTVTFNQPVVTFGLEAQPNTSVVSSILASFYQGASLIGEIPLDVDGNAGARLFAAASTTPFDKIVFSSTDDFAIAQIRASVPEPSSLVMLALGAAAVFAAAWARPRDRAAMR